MTQRSYTIALQIRNDPPKDCTLTLEDSGSGHVVLSTIHPVSGLELSFSASDYYNAFKELRRLFEKDSIRALCAGSRVNAVCSGMSSQMSMGLKIYLAEIGKQTSMKDLTDLFAPAPSDSISTVAEQETFYRGWADAFRNKV